MKKSGVALLATIISIAVLLLVSGGFFTILASNTGLIKSGGESLQAQYFAQLEADTIKMLSYDEVDNITQDTWQEFDIDNSWQYKVNVGPEQNVGDSDNTMKIASISVRKNGDTINRFALDVPLSSQSSSLSVPVGTIWPYTGDLNEIPDDWHLCDGTNGTPDLRNRFLEGTTTKANMFVEAGLPNITGKHYTDNTSSEYYYSPSGVYTYIHGKNLTLEGSTSYTSGWLLFDASRCSSIYGNSNTVQPASYTVYYIMKIK